MKTRSKFWTLGTVAAIAATAWALKETVPWCGHVIATTVHISDMVEAVPKRFDDQRMLITNGFGEINTRLDAAADAVSRNTRRLDAAEQWMSNTDYRMGKLESVQNYPKNDLNHHETRPEGN